MQLYRAMHIANWQEDASNKILMQIEEYNKLANLFHYSGTSLIQAVWYTYMATVWYLKNVHN